MVLAIVELTLCWGYKQGKKQWLYCLTGTCIAENRVLQRSRERTPRQTITREIFLRRDQSSKLKPKRRGEISHSGWDSDLGRGARTWHSQGTGGNSGWKNEQGWGGVETDEAGEQPGPRHAGSVRGTQGEWQGADLRCPWLSKWDFQGAGWYNFEIYDW